MKLWARLSVLALAALGAPLSTASAGQYVTNGGFESSAYQGSSQPFFGPSTPATDWSSNGEWLMFCSSTGVTCDDSAVLGGAALYPSPLQLSPQGGNFIAIDGTPGFDGIISQTINGLTPGETLTLSFYMSTAEELNSDTTDTEQVVATLGGETFTTPTITNDYGVQTPWVRYSTTFKYSGPGDILSFINNGTGVPPYALIDGVSLTGGVPEPGAWAMILVGCAGLGLIARVRRRAAAVTA